MRDNTDNSDNNHTGKVFVPFSEDLLATTGTPLGELVPFQLDYRCVHLLDGTYEFEFTTPAEGSLKTTPQMGHAA